MLTSVARDMMRGDTLVIDYKVFKDATTGLPVPGAVGQIFDLTGSKAWWTAKNNVVVQDNEAVFQRTSTPANGIVFTDAVQGKLRVTIDPANTRAMPDQVTALVYDLQIQTPAGAIVTLEMGTMVIVPDITRAT